MFGQKTAHFTILIGQITKDPGFTDTGGDAGRFHTLLQTVETEGTLVGPAVLLIDVTGIVRTGGDTGLAAYALVAVYQDNAVFALVGGPGGTGRDAGGVIAVVTKLGTEFGPQLWEFPLGYLQDPGPEVLKGDLILLDTGRYTGHTADTSTLVYYHGILFHFNSPSLS